MQEFKITHFERDNPELTFPRFETVSTDEARKIRERLARSLHMDSDSSGLDLLNRITSLSQNITSADAEDQSFSLYSILTMYGVSVEKDVLVNWYRFDEIDRINLGDLALHFSDVWYPSSDDIEIFDESLEWILSVDHHGLVSFCNLAQA